ncbi:anti-sigma factor [Phenylobacterium sp. J426]|uniref:anti-sigma factor family protein n=1 Tax=Phenylobacterium sp. J426 TaxID=2898439 RepID=UPI002150F035|nr:anti-sigma factor [Phenylobacterium sp. J426]MCR5876768.1 anti-sigma factor [Phenylobacterium sp. J426]
MKDRDLTVAAYVDGELDAQARARFEAEIAVDPSLAREVAAQRRLRARLAAAYDPVLAEALPLELTLAAQAVNDRPAKRFGLPHWAAVAASLVAGVLVGRTTIVEPDALAARGQLAQALDRQLAADGGPIQVGLSFQANDGRYCRTFQSAPDRRAGLACRDGGGWRLRTVTAWAPANVDYRTAGVDTPPEVLAAVDALIAGEPLDAAAERAARARGWKP